MPIRDFDTIGQLVVVDRFSYDASGATNITADDVIGAIDDLDGAVAGGGGGSGDVTGPASATDNAVARFNLTTGKIIQNSGVTIDDSGNIATSGTVDGRDLSTDGTKLDGIASGAVADHGALSGLSDDDHIIYAKTITGYLSSGYVLVTGASNRDIETVNVTIDGAGNISPGGTVDGRDVAVDGTKLDGIASGAVADHGALSGLGDDDHTIYTKNVTSHSASGFITTTGATSRDLAQSAAAVDVGGNFSTTGDISTSGGNILVFGTVDGRDVATDGTKLDTIETSATADQTDAEIRAAVEAATDSNVFTDTDHSKLNGIEAAADVTDATNVAAAGAVMDGDFSTSGMMVRTAAGTYLSRTISASTGISVSNGDGVLQDPRISVDSTVLQDSEFSSNGIMTRTAAGTYANRTITAGTGISVANGNGVSGNPTITCTVTDTDTLPRTVVRFVGSASTSSSTKPLGMGDIVGMAGNSIGIRMPFDGDIRNITLVVDCTAASGGPKLGWILYKATASNTSYGLFDLNSSGGTSLTVASNISTDEDFAAGVLSFNEGDYISFTYFKQGGTSATVNDLRAFITLQAT